MRTISFYSFKGGVGRTSLVLNLAYELAMRAKFVVVADWDLHAPGLSLMEDLAMPDGPFPRKGILDFLSSALQPLSHAGDAQVDVIDPFLLAQGTLLAERSRPDHPTFGDLYFIPAGSFGAGDSDLYPATLRQLRLPELTTWRARLPGTDHEQSVLLFFRERVEAVRSPIFGRHHKPDFLLLDSRTGITEIGDLLLGNPVDHYVVLFGLNEQNQVGMEMIVRAAQRRVKPGALPDVLTLIASPVPVGEEDLLRERLDALSARLSVVARAVDGTGTLEVLPRVLRIPYHPRLALREEIILERYPDSSLAQTYREIASHVLQEARAPERAEALLRGQVLSEVPRSSSTRFEDIVPSYGLPFQHRGPRVKAPRPFVQPPPWSWATPHISMEYLIPDTPHSAMLLDGLAWSTSLGVQEKVRVLEFASTLPAPRIARLAEPFGAERAGREESWEYRWEVIEKDLARAAVEWIEVLQEEANVDPREIWSSLADGTEDLLPSSLATPRFLFIVARELLKQGRLSSAAPLLNKVLHDEAFSPVAGRATSVIERLNDLDVIAVKTDEDLLSASELNAFEAILTIHPEGIDSWLRAIAGLRMARWNEEAIALADRVSKLEITKTFDAWFELSVEYERLSVLRSAEMALQCAIALSSDSSIVWTKMARYVGGQGRYDEAVAALEKASGYAAEPEEWRHIATTYSETVKDYPKAISLYHEKVIMSRGPDLQSEIELAEIAISARALEQAEDALKRARILSKGPILDGDPFSRRRAEIILVEIVLEMAFGLLRKDHRMVIEASEQLIASHGRYKPYDSWIFESFLASLNDLSETEQALVRSAADVVQGAPPKALEEAYAAWRIAHAITG